MRMIRRALRLLLSLWLLSPWLCQAQDITTGLVAHYQLNDTGSTATDSSGIGNNAALVGTPVWGTGKIGGSIEFNSSDDYVHDATGASLPTGATAAFTLAGWMKAAAYTDLANLFGFGFYPPDNTGLGLLRSILLFNSRYYFWGANADWDTGISFDADNVWHHLAFTASSTTLTFYRDGTQRAQTTRPAALAQTDVKITLGSRHTAGSAFVGALDDVRIYARELTSSDITALVALGTASASRRRVLIME